MIGRLKGVLLEKEPPHLLVDVQGVAYELQAPMSTFYSFSEIGSVVILYTHLSISDAAHQLYGFHTKGDRSLFRRLIKVNGVGPRMALGVMSGMEREEFVRAVLRNDLSALVKLPGIGKKTAERLVIEMRDRLQDWDVPVTSSANPVDSQTAGVQVASGTVMQSEAESALIALGYKPAEANRAIRKVLERREVERSEELIRLALRSMIPSA